MPSVALNVGANRIEVGTAITHPLGDPGLSEKEEFELRRRLVTDALALLAERIDEQKVRRLAS
jgi:glycine reductase